MKLIKFFLIFTVIVISLTMVLNVQRGLALKKNQIFIQPFDLLYDSNDSHVMLYFKGHPEYEAVEAMIKRKQEEKNLIRVIITKHDNTQIDFINNKNFVKNLKEQSFEREVYYTPIKYEKKREDGKIHVSLNFVTNKDEKVDFDFYAASKVSKKHAGLVDPEGHSEENSLPIMVNEKTTLASPKSSISFNGEEYKIPRKIWIPIFFTGMEGYYSKNFDMLIFRTGTKKLKLINSPKQLSAGRKWVYENKGRKEVYEIIEKKDKKVKIKHENERIAASLENNAFLIKKISFRKNTDSNGKFSIVFDPYLPFSIDDENLKGEARFKVLYNKEKLVDGVLKAKEKNELKYLELIPENPEWAAKRNLSVYFSNQGNSNYLLTEVGE